MAPTMMKSEALRWRFCFEKSVPENIAATSGEEPRKES